MISRVQGKGTRASRVCDWTLLQCFPTIINKAHLTLDCTYSTITSLRSELSELSEPNFFTSRGTRIEGSEALNRLRGGAQHTIFDRLPCWMVMMFGGIQATDRCNGLLLASHTRSMAKAGYGGMKRQMAMGVWNRQNKSPSRCMLHRDWLVSCRARCSLK